MCCGLGVAVSAIGIHFKGCIRRKGGIGIVAKGKVKARLRINLVTVLPGWKVSLYFLFFQGHVPALSPIKVSVSRVLRPCPLGRRFP